MRVERSEFAVTRSEVDPSQIVQKRRFLQNKLWRMVRKGQIQNVKNARGVFRLEGAKPRPRQGRRRK